MADIMNKFFAPKSVAVIGASGTAGKPGNVVVRNMLDAGFKGKIHLVNPRGGEIEGLPVVKSIDDLPKRLAGHRHANAYFGIIRLEIGDELAKGDEQEEFIQAALDMEKSVESAIAENSLNPANIEAAIRKALLPRLFGLTGLDKAKVITEKVVEVTRIGLARGSGAKT